MPPAGAMPKSLNMGVLPAQGRSLRQMARALGIGVSTLHRALAAHDLVAAATGGGSVKVASAAG